MPVSSFRIRYRAPRRCMSQVAGPFRERGWRARRLSAGAFPSASPVPGRARFQRRNRGYDAPQMKNRWVCDLFIVVTATFQRLYAFVLLDIGTRRIVHWNLTDRPRSEWTIQQFRNALPLDGTYRFLVHDRDGIFAPAVDEALRSMSLQVLKTLVRSRPRQGHTDHAPGRTAVGRPRCRHTRSRRSAIATIASPHSCRTTSPSYGQVPITCALSTSALRRGAAHVRSANESSARTAGKPLVSG